MSTVTKCFMDTSEAENGCLSSTRKEQAPSKLGCYKHIAKVQQGEDQERLAAGASEKEEPAHPYIIDPAESALMKVETIPSRSITFFPNEKRQQTHIILHNRSDRKVMFKMKSTRPGLYKMKPVLGVINPGEKKSKADLESSFYALQKSEHFIWEPTSTAVISLYSIRIVYLGIKIGYRIPLNDRITIVLATVSRKGDKGLPDKSMFKGETEGEMRKRRIYVLYQGVNDKKDLEEEDKRKSAEKAPIPKGMNPEEQRVYVDGYDEGYKAALTENLGGSKEYMGASKALEHLQKTKNFGQQKAFQQGFTEGYEKAKALLKSAVRGSKEPVTKPSKEKVKLSKEKVSKERVEQKKESKEVVKLKALKEGVKAPSKEAIKAPSREKVKAPSKEVIKLAPEVLISAREPEAFMLGKEKPSDGRNVIAVTPGGTAPSLGDQLKKHEIVRVDSSGKRQIIILMYRDLQVPENLISRSGDEEDTSTDSLLQEPHK